MKRSKILVLTTLMAGAGVSLTACDAVRRRRQAGRRGRATRPSRECKAAGTIPAAQCDTAYAQAQKAKRKTAPRFGDRQTCEEQYGVGQCVPRNQWQLLHAAADRLHRRPGAQQSGGGYRGAPMYRDRNGDYYGGAGGLISRDYVTGRTRVGSDAFDPAARAPARVQSRSSVISRGGFGGGGRGFGG